MTERWLPVLGFEGLYEVSDLGRVRAVERTLCYERICPSGRVVQVRRHYPAVLLKPGTVKSGHKLVVLGRGNPRLVHRLVLDAFVGPRPPGKEALHGDGDPANNRLTNLRWGTRSENMRDAIRHGTYRSCVLEGAKPRAILRPEDINPIRARLTAGESHSSIGRDYGVGRSAIAQIGRGKTWADIPWESA